MFGSSLGQRHPHLYPPAPGVQQLYLALVVGLVLRHNAAQLLQGSHALCNCRAGGQAEQMFGGQTRLW